MRVRVSAVPFGGRRLRRIAGRPRPGPVLAPLALAAGLPAATVEKRSTGQRYEELHRQISIDYCASLAPQINQP